MILPPGSWPIPLSGRVPAKLKAYHHHQKRQKHSSRSRILEERSIASSSFPSAIMLPTSSPAKSMRRASSPPPMTPHTSSESPLRRSASSPSFCFLPCSLSELLLNESPQSTPTPPRRWETEAYIAGIEKQMVKTGDSVPQLPFQGYTSGYWEGDFWTRSTQTEGAKESSTQTEPLSISSDGVRLNNDDTRHSFSGKFAPRWNSTPFLIVVAALVIFVFVLVVIGTVLGTYNSNSKMDSLEVLPDLFENEPPHSVVRGQVVNFTTTTKAHVDTIAPVVAKRSVTAVHSARSAKVRKATNTAHRESIPTEDARSTTYAVRKLPITVGLGSTSTPSTTMGHRKGVQVVGPQVPAQRKYHLDEVTGNNDVLSRMAYEFDANNISELPGEYAGFRPKKRMRRSPSTTPAGDFVDEIV
ncbi:uncharacterized protein LOC142777221 isoform X2 [Rhipicephalus microplus]|uniref:uncharacterized protein LOC142777221 isoform X2 n=1 Tax=Rhipicephalus microplus TaxID=6941 RepID=UPI003F6BA0F3